MQQVALYYPTMQPPASSWLMRVLLYWDQVATIVPRNLQDEILQDPFTWKLHEAGLLVMIDPEQTVRDSGAYREIVEALQIMSNNLKLGGNPNKWSWERVHTDKFSEAMLGQLRSTNRIDRSARPNGWLRMERQTADIYMGLLAGTASAVHSRQNTDSSMVAVTDSRTSLQRLSAGGPRNERTRRYHLSVLDNVLPAPSKKVDPQEIRDFKDENNEALLRLRSWVEQRSIESNRLEGEELDEWLNFQRGDYDSAIEALSNDMRRRRWPTLTFTGFGTVLGSGLGVVGDTVSGADALSLGMLIGSGVLGLGAAGFDLIEKLREPSYDVHAPLAYAALAQRRWQK